MRRILPALLVASLTILLVAGCGGGGSSTPGTPETASYLPLAVGNEWHYQYNEYTQTGSMAARGALVRHHQGLAPAAAVQPKDLSAEDIVQITGTESINGAEWFSAVAHYVGGELGSPLYMRHTTQGLQRKDSLSDPAFFMIRMPLTVGTTWTVPFVVNGITYHEQFSITALGQSVSTPAGVFNNCLVIENVFQQTGQPDDVITYWYEPGVGEVREEDHLGTTLVYELELLEAPTLAQ